MSLPEILLYLDASSEKIGKGSFHFHSPYVKFENIETQRRFWNEIYVRLKHGKEWWFIDDTGKSYVLKTFIDFNIYNTNRQMRIVYSSKMDEEGIPRRPLMPTGTFMGEKGNNSIDIEDYLITSLSGDEILIDVSSCNSDMICTGRNVYSKQLIQEIIDKRGLEVTVDSLRGSLITLRNKRKVRTCIIHGEENESDNAYLTITKSGQLKYHCHDEGCKGKSKIIHVFDNLSRQMELERTIPLKRYRDDFIRNVHNYEDQGRWISRVRLDMNRYCCLIEDSSRSYVVYRKISANIATGIQEVKYICKFPSEFHITFGTYKYSPFNKEGKQGQSNLSIIDLWLDWDGRKVCDSMDCDPTMSTNENILNTYEGLAITEEMAYEYIFSDDDIEDLSRWLDFIERAWCNGDEVLYDYVIKWLASLVQKPGVKLGTALVLQGEEGAGKGHVVQTIAKIIGDRYFLQPTSQDEVLGDFNEMIDGRLLVFADEMFWGGEKKKSAILKKLLTEKKITINGKGIPHRSSSNRFNMIFASNEDWVVPASKSSRRYNVLQVSSGPISKMSRKEKKRLCEINPYVVANYLYKVNLKNFDPTKIIDTIGLKSQKEQSMPPVHQWYVDELLCEDGEIFKYGKWIRKESLYESFSESGMGKHAYPRISKVVFFQEFLSLYPFKIAKKRIGLHCNPVSSILIPSQADLVQSFNKMYRCQMIVLPSIIEGDDD
jgi:hypothetical protein